MQQNHPQCLLNTIHYFKENELADYQLTNRQEYEWLRTLLHRPSLLSDLRPDFCEPVSVGLSLIHGSSGGAQNPFLLCQPLLAVWRQKRTLFGCHLSSLISKYELLLESLYLDFYEMRYEQAIATAESALTKVDDERWERVFRFMIIYARHQNFLSLLGDGGSADMELESPRKLDSNEVLDLHTDRQRSVYRQLRQQLGEFMQDGRAVISYMDWILPIQWMLTRFNEPPLVDEDEASERMWNVRSEWIRWYIEPEEASIPTCQFLLDHLSSHLTKSSWNPLLSKMTKFTSDPAVAITWNESEEFLLGIYHQLFKSPIKQSDLTFQRYRNFLLSKSQSGALTPVQFSQWIHFLLKQIDFDIAATTKPEALSGSLQLWKHFSLYLLDPELKPLLKPRVSWWTKCLKTTEILDQLEQLTIQNRGTTRMVLDLVFLRAVIVDVLLERPEVAPIRPFTKRVPASRCGLYRAVLSEFVVDHQSDVWKLCQSLLPELSVTRYFT